jgi:antitoxin (DNA-binding transcriptional repressor) of toxin-antitoxin stability system
MREIHLEEAKTQWEELIKAAVAGETIIVATDDDCLAVQLMPVRFGRGGKPTFGSGKGLFTMADDFDAPDVRR